MKKGLIYTIITALAFVTFEPVSKLIAGSVSPFGIAFWRFILGAVLLCPFAIIKIKKEKINIIQWKPFYYKRCDKNVYKKS